MLVEFETLLVDKLVKGIECGGGSTENLQTEPGPFCRRGRKSCWERISEARELGGGRELSEGHPSREEAKGLALPKQVTSGQGKGGGRDRHGATDGRRRLVKMAGVQGKKEGVWF